MIEYDRYNDCDFTFEDEVNLSHKIYGKRKKNIVMYSESNYAVKL